MTRNERAVKSRWRERGSFFLFAAAIAAFLALIVVGVWQSNLGELLLSGTPR